MSDEPSVAEVDRAALAVGRLMLFTAAIDDQLNQICIALLELPNHPMVEPIVASLDLTPKAAIVKAYARQLSAQDWRAKLIAHAELAEKVNSQRNKAAHSRLTFREGKAKLDSMAAAKLFKSIDLEAGVSVRIDVAELDAAIEDAERAIASGKVVLLNLAELNARRGSI